MAESGQTTVWTEFRLCLGLLTRLPAGGAAVPDPSVMARSARWFPAVGALVGLLSACILYAGERVGLTAVVTVLMAVGFSILVTGALHEDGLADMADGFGGGSDRQTVLDIMRDSRIGAYGVLALIMSVALRVELLAALMDDGLGNAASAMIVAAAASRLTPVLLMNRLPAARSDGMAAGAGTPDGETVRIAGGLTLAALLLLPGLQAMLVTIAATAVAATAVGALARRRIGGQTGDVLGAGQQITEIAVLLGLAVVGP